MAEKNCHHDSSVGLIHPPNPLLWKTPPLQHHRHRHRLLLRHHRHHLRRHRHRRHRKQQTCRSHWWWDRGPWNRRLKRWMDADWCEMKIKWWWDSWDEDHDGDFWSSGRFISAIRSKCCKGMQAAVSKHKSSKLLWFLLLMEEILHQLIGSLSHYLQGFIHPRWCRISSINSIIYPYWNPGSGPLDLLHHLARLLALHALAHLFDHGIFIADATGFQNGGDVLEVGNMPQFKQVKLRAGENMGLIELNWIIMHHLNRIQRSDHHYVLLLMMIPYGETIWTSTCAPSPVSENSSILQP